MMQPVIQHIKQALLPLYPESEVKALTGLLLEKVFGVRMLDIYMGKDIHFLPEKEQELEDILQRLSNAEPIQYVLGEADFCGLTFEVNRNVLIPRPETAELVYWILEEMPASPCRVLDIGTGSGCIPITLFHHRPMDEVVAWDISLGALEVAQANNRKHQTDVLFEQRDVLSDVWTESRRFDVIVSNPPYITGAEKVDMERNVLEWEPELALFVPDADPLLFYHRIALLGRELLKPAGCIYFEINRAFGTEISSMLDVMGYKEVVVKKDLSGNDRMVKAEL